MSIGFTFKAKTRKIDALKESVKEMAEESGYGLALNENWLTVSFCTMGDLSMEWERESGLRGQWLITGNCCSTPAGAGFHAAAVRFLDELGQKRLSELLVDDETEYYNHRDFERMKREHFYPWLNALKRHCAERGSGYSNFCLCWDMEQYQPEEVPGTVITPMGRFNIENMIKQTEKNGISWLAERFFIWDNEEKDALYYRNTALNYLWEQCCFVPSRRSSEDSVCNQMIIDSLEQAAVLNPGPPLPVDAYREICSLADREPSIKEDAPKMESDYPVGFRKREVTHSFGTLRLTLPGRLKYEWETYGDGDGCNMWRDSASDSPVWRVSGFRLRSGNAEFPEECSQNEPEEFEIPGGRARIGWIEYEEDGQIAFQAVCDVVSGPSQYLITAAYMHKEEKDGIYALMRKLKTVPDTPAVTNTESYAQ